jgi:hypothetical protein
MESRVLLPPYQDVTLPTIYFNPHHPISQVKTSICNQSFYLLFPLTAMFLGLDTSCETDFLSVACLVDANIMQAFLRTVSFHVLLTMQLLSFSLVFLSSRFLYQLVTSLGVARFAIDLDFFIKASFFNKLF